MVVVAAGVVVVVTGGLVVVVVATVVVAAVVVVAGSVVVATGSVVVVVVDTAATVLVGPLGTLGVGTVIRGSGAGVGSGRPSNSAWTESRRNAARATVASDLRCTWS